MTEKSFSFENGYSDWLKRVKPYAELSFLESCTLEELFNRIEEYFESLQETKKVAVETPGSVISEANKSDRLIKKITIEEVKDWKDNPTIPGLAAALEISRQGLEKFIESSVEEPKVKMIEAAARYIEEWTVNQGMKGKVRGEFTMFTMKNVMKYREEQKEKAPESTRNVLEIFITAPKSIPENIGEHMVIDAEEIKNGHLEEKSSGK